MTDKAQGAAELLPCPFCGGAARIESNRDWHRLCADHDENCVFDSDDADLMYPAQDGYLKTIPEVWNRRAALKAQPAPTEAQITVQDVRDSARLAWSAALDSAAFYVVGHCGDGDFHAEAILGMPMPKIKFRNEIVPTEAQGEDSARLDALVREAQANAVLGFAEAMVEVGIADSRIRLMAAGTAARIRVPSVAPAIPGTKEAES